MSSSAVLPAQNIPLIDWSQETLDNVLLQGDKMYLHALGNGYLENTDTLEERLAMKSEAENMADFHVCWRQLVPSPWLLVPPVTTDQAHFWARYNFHTPLVFSK